VHIDIEAYQDTIKNLGKDRCDEIADFIIKSLEWGKGTLERSARTLKFHDFTINVKENYAISSDFSWNGRGAFYLYKIGKFRETEPYLLIYADRQDSFLNTIYTGRQKDKTSISSTIAGQKVFLYNFEDSGSSVFKDKAEFFTAVKIPCPPGKDFGYLNINVYPGSESGWKEIQEMLESIVFNNLTE